MVSQVFAVLGLVAGLWAAGWVSQWVGAHWDGARPAVAFLILRWLVVVLSAMAVAALFHFWGELLRDAVKATPLGWVDRPAGFVIGAALGAAVASFIVLSALLIPWPDALPHTAARARVSRPLMAGAASTCSLASRLFPGSNWLKDRFLAAEQRAHGARHL